MKDNPQSRTSDGPSASRRGFIGAAMGLAAAITAESAVGAAVNETHPSFAPSSSRQANEPFWGEHQGGIITAQQSHTYFAAFDLTTEKRDEIVAMLREWTSTAARLTQGVDPESLGGLAGEMLRGPLGNAFLVGKSVMPALGQEGELLAAWSVARIITRTDRKKERMRREMWSKVELG